MDQDLGSNTYTVRVRLFGFSSRIVGKSEVLVILNGPTNVSGIREELLTLYPGLSRKDIPFVIALNRKVVSESTIVTEGDEIALLPPVSGG